MIGLSFRVQIYDIYRGKANWNSKLLRFYSVQWSEQTILHEKKLRLRTGRNRSFLCYAKYGLFLSKHAFVEEDGVEASLVELVVQEREILAILVGIQNLMYGSEVL